MVTLNIVACQAHPALVKIGLVLARLFIFNSLLVRLHSTCVWTKGLTDRVSPRLGGLAAFGDPAPLAHDNILRITKSIVM